MQSDSNHAHPAAPPTFFTILCTLVGIKDFADLCRTVYFPAEDFSDATFAVVNAMLYNLFVEQHSLAKDEALREEYNSYVTICKTNLETTLANFPLFLSPKIENVQALLLGVSVLLSNIACCMRDGFVMC